MMKAFLTLALVAALSVTDAFTGTSPLGLASKTASKTELNAIGLSPMGVGGVDYYNYRRPNSNYGSNYDYDYGGIRRGGYGGGYGSQYGGGMGHGMGYPDYAGGQFHNARDTFVNSPGGITGYNYDNTSYGRRGMNGGYYGGRNGMQGMNGYANQGMQGRGNYYNNGSYYNQGYGQGYGMNGGYGMHGGYGMQGMQNNYYGRGMQNGYGNGYNSYRGNGYSNYNSYGGQYGNMGMTGGNRRYGDRHGMSNGGYGNRGGYGGYNRGVYGY